jgi:O-antigen/teichoic acid export membrane protein
LLPELIHAINQRAQTKVESIFGVVWFVLLVILIPGFMVMQIAIGPVFDIWTQGKIAFDPLLFAFFSGTILFYTAGQPAFAVLSGNNLLKEQLRIIICVSAAAILLLLALVPVFGVHGAALSLLVVELGSLAFLSLTCSRWMQRNDLVWPWHSQRVVLAGTFIAVFALVLSSQLSFRFSLFVSLGMWLLSLYLAFHYYRTLPNTARERMRSIILAPWHIFS